MNQLTIRNRREKPLAWALLALIAALMLGAGYRIGDARPAEANHPSSVRIASIEVGGSPGTAENYCAMIVPNGTTSHATALSALSTALSGNGSGDYDGLASGLVSFIQSGTPCSGSVPDGNSIRYRISDHWNATCGVGVNCARLVGSFFSHNGHNDYNSSDVFIRDDSLTNHTINHETGHSLGMWDGDGTCPGSIMHSISYGCGSSPPYPTSNDQATVTSNAAGNP